MAGMKALRIVILALLFVALSAAHAQQPCPERAKTEPHAKYPKIKIERVEFIGESVLLDSIRDELTRALQTEREGRPEWRNELEEIVRSAWQDRGYFRADFRTETILLSQSDSHQTLALRVHVNDGMLYRLDDIEVRHPDPNRALYFSAVELRDLFPLRRNDSFHVGRIRQGIDNLKRKYAPPGFIDMVAEPQTEVDNVDGTIRLRIFVNEGKQFRVGEVRAPSDLKLEAFLRSHLRTGEIFDYAALERALAANKDKLPPGFGPERIEIRRNLPEGTVDLHVGSYATGCPPQIDNAAHGDGTETPTLRKRTPPPS